MELRRDFRIGVGILIGLNTLLALVAIGLLHRISPAVQLILRENVASIAAVEEILTIFASIEGVITEPAREAASSALERVKKNVTEPQETPVLARIEAEIEAALQGDPIARREVTSSLVELSGINRRAISQADAEARRLGLSGAWVAVFLAIASLLISFGVMFQLERRLVRPFLELREVLREFRVGNWHRRCHLVSASGEVREVFDSLNAVFDRAVERFEALPAAPESRSPIERVALIHFLNSYGRPALVLNREGQIIASNEQALVALSEPEGDLLRSALDQVAQTGEAREILEAIRLDEAGWLCVQERPRRKLQDV